MAGSSPSDGTSASRWLVTGAGGQLGRAVLALADANRICAQGASHGELDIADAASVKAALVRLRPDVVLNCAAFTAVDRCETEPETARRANAVGPEVLAAACAGGPLLVHVSTDYVVRRPRAQTDSRERPHRARSACTGAASSKASKRSLGPAASS